jgi:uncharacterized cupin superfamily protein
MTQTQTKPVMSLADVALRDGGNGKAFKARVGSFGRQIGSKGMGVMLHVVEPGEKAFPFHVHHQIEELFVILEGEGTYRFGGERFAIKAGDVCAAPAGGPDKAHQILNTGKTMLRYLGISTMAETEVVEYPDSKKFAVASRFDWSNPKAGGIRYVGRVESSLNYFDGEE